MSNENKDCLRRSGASSRLKLSCGEQFRIEFMYVHNFQNVGINSLTLTCVFFAPHTVPSALRVMRPEPSLKPHGSTPGLERAEQINATRTRLG
ncbi:hypothetical protein V6N13_070548 [Hibiscus sabdariffa]